MKFIVRFVLILSIGCCVSCAGKKPKIIKKTTFAPTGLSAKLVNKQRLKEGGNIVVVPFVPGSGVEANKTQERVALMIVKGVIDIIQDEHLNFTVLFADKAELANLAIKGRITVIKTPSRFKRMLRDKILVLSAECRMLDIDTDDTILVYSDTKKGIVGDSDLMQMGYSFGQDLGRFIASNIN